jgi:hypothetical protein
MDERLTHRFWKHRSVVKNMKAFWRSFVLEVDIGYLIRVRLPILAQDIMNRSVYPNEVTEL